MRTTFLKLIALFVFCLSLAACEFGQVEQGRCVAFDPDKQTFTLVLDVKHDVENPSYTGGIMNYTLPADPDEIGPLPTPGGRVMIDQEKNLITLYLNGELVNVPVEFTDIQKGVASHNPKVKDVKYPIIDKEQGTVTEYSRRLQEIVTFKVPAEYIDLPASTWEAGDEIRIYYKENAKHQALRLMNVTKTNIFKR